jgi:hypothetical protein
MPSAAPRESRTERELKARVAALEGRVVWLEEMLRRVLGEPANHAQAAAEAAPPIVPNPMLDRFLLRTQPMPTLAFPPGPASSDMLDAPPPEPAGLLAPWTLELDDTLGGMPRVGPASASVPAARAVPAASSASVSASARRDAAAAAPAAPPPAFVPAPVAITPPARLAARKEPVSLGITAAFSTLEDQIALAADAELAVATRRRPAAARVEALPELLATGRLIPTPLLEVNCALEMLNPSILQQIMAIWHLPECATRLHRLLQEDRNSRAGLDPAVRDELEMLGDVRAMLTAQGA